MKNHLFLLPPLVMLGVLMSCQSQQSADESTKTGSIGQPSMATIQCFAFTSPQDSIQVTLMRNGTIITGKLRYQLAGKDHNAGTLKGRMTGDTLLADYIFQSEGVESVREVAFLLKGGHLIEGYGPVDERSKKMVFTDKHKLRFDEAMPLTPVDCPK